MKQTAVEWLYEKIKSNIDAEDGSMYMNWLHDDTFQKAKEMENEQQQGKKMYSEEEVDVLVDMLQKCKEYFLLKTDSKSEERADAIGEVLKQFKNK